MYSFLVNNKVINFFKKSVDKCIGVWYYIIVQRERNKSWGLTQLVERWTLTPKVIGSRPMSSV